MKQFIKGLIVGMAIVIVYHIATLETCAHEHDIYCEVYTD
jgi:hypothetical protein